MNIQKEIVNNFFENLKRIDLKDGYYNVRETIKNYNQDNLTYIVDYFLYYWYPSGSVYSVQYFTENQINCFIHRHSINKEFYYNTMLEYFIETYPENFI